MQNIISILIYDKNIIIERKTQLFKVLIEFIDLSSYQPTSFAEKLYWIVSP